MSVPTGQVTLRDAVAADAAAVAALHVASWRSAYRGMRSDAYLDGPMEAERHAIWRERFAAPDALRIVVVAESGPERGAERHRGAELLAFACLALGDDPVHGTLIDNLHARPGQLGRGLGGRVLAAALDRLSDEDLDRPIHLTVLQPNARARAVYAAWGGREAETLDEPGPDGSHVPVLRVVWRRAADLADRLARGRTGETETP